MFMINLGLKIHLFPSNVDLNIHKAIFEGKIISNIL